MEGKGSADKGILAADGSRGARPGYPKGTADGALQRTSEPRCCGKPGVSEPAQACLPLTPGAGAQGQATSPADEALPFAQPGFCVVLNGHVSTTLPSSACPVLLIRAPCRVAATTPLRGSKTHRPPARANPHPRSLSSRFPLRGTPASPFRPRSLCSTINERSSRPERTATSPAGSGRDCFRLSLVLVVQLVS